MDRKVYEFISKQTGDPIVERKTCTVSGEPFAIFQSDLDFYNKISPTFNGTKYAIPAPILCPQERQRRRLAFLNERKLYKTHAPSYGVDMVSIYSPDKNIDIYPPKDYFSDKRDPKSFGRDFDFGKSASAQFFEMWTKMPQRSLMQGNSVENSDYTNGVGSSKDCYLVFQTDASEKCMYGTQIKYCKNCMDCSYINHCDNCYQCIACANSNKLFFSKNCDNCNYCAYIINCTGCSHCLFCSNLSNQSYYIHNKKVSPKEYEEAYKRIQEKDDFLDQQIRQGNELKNTENTSGNNINNASDSVLCYDCDGIQSCRYSYSLANGAKDCADVDGVGLNIDTIYNSITILKNSSHVYFSQNCRSECYNVFYSNTCKACKNIFFCTGLVHKEYCILNKQYTKAEYEKLVSEIIEHMIEAGERGEWFHPLLSPFGYNETLAQEYFPLTKEQAIEKGFKWSDYEAPFPKTDAKDVVICEVSGKPFRLIQQELEFYKKHNLPLPTKHPDIRHMERLTQKPGRELFLRTCDKCGIQLLSVYIQESKFKVFCQSCYNKEIYG